MSAVAEVVIGIVLLVGALLAVDWFTAGRPKRRALVSARDQNTDNTGVYYAEIENQGHSGEYQSGSGL